MTKDSVVTFTNVIKRYPKVEKPVLDGVSLSVPRGKVTVVLGPSGSGKSTLLRTVAGLEDIQGGTISLDGNVIASEKMTGARRSQEIRTRIGMVFQSYDLFPHKTVLGNVMMSPILVQKRKKEEVREEALQLLDRVGLQDRANAKPHELSGGQRQRVAIARSLIMHPDVMLFDEVTAALDPEMVHEVLNVIVELADLGMTMMIVTHEMEFARAVADHIVLLEDGGIVEESYDSEAFFTHPETERAQQFLRTFEFERSRSQKK
ncbi:amino acid ABC transporter ATP-binding protein [Alloscardovia venturai]|uniref:Amino acid ABC transporter ATP-binding protein n=1 Tax=Alloscardovia venturai TaxID=1769421 RepID=A0ABW2Y8Q5_9BIFI